MKLSTRLAALPLLSVIALCGAGLSQAHAVEVPNSVAPGQIDKRFQSEPQPAANQLELQLPAPTDTRQLSDVLRAQLEKNKFQLNAIEFEGASVYTAEQLKPAYESKLGQTISLLDARDIAAEITNAYHNNGFILTQAVVPAQEVNKGVLKIRIVEGYIGNVTFKGDSIDDGQRRLLETYAEKIMALRPVSLAELERYMLLMNDLPGTTATGLIRPSSANTGSADLILSVSKKSVEGSYTFDNRGTKYIGPWQHTMTLGVNSLLNPYDHTQVRVATTNPFKELFGIEVQHDEILNSEGTKLTGVFSHTRTQPEDDLKYLHIVGDSNLFEAKVSHPFLRGRQQSVVGRALVDFRDSSTDVFGNQRLNTDHLRVARVGGNYSFLDTARGSNSLDMQLSQGMNIFNATEKGTDRSNANGDSAFTKLNFDASRLQQLPYGMSLLASATGQFSFNPLLTDEQFSLGGSEYGRAFDAAEALGDSGIGARTELRYGQSVGENYLDSYQLDGFFDLGDAWTRKITSGSSDMVISSTGVGTRVNFNGYTSGSAELAVPVIKPNADQTAYRNDPRVFFSVSAHF